MATAGSILLNVRKIFGDADRDWLDDTTGLDWLNQAQRRFCHKVLPLDEIKDFTITQYVKRYDLPTDCIMPVWVKWYKNREDKLEYTPPDVWAELEVANPTGEGTPESYAVIRRQLVIGPRRPNSTSATSTASGAITSTASTLGLTAASGTFRSKGYVKINSEIIEYTGVATTTLTGCIRGKHGTTAASHASADTVTEIDMQMLYRKAPAAISATTTSPDIPEYTHEYLEKYILYLAWLAQGNKDKAAAALEEFHALEEDMRKTIGRRAQDGLLRIREKTRRMW